MVELLKQLGEIATVIGAFTALCIFLGKKYIEGIFQKDLKLFEAGLKDASTKYQITFSSLHSKRAEIITEIFELIVTTEISMGAYLKTKDNNIREAESKVKADMDVLRERYYKTELYFSDSINEKVLAIFNEFVGVWADYSTTFAYGDLQPDQKELWKEKQGLFNDAVHSLTKKIPALKLELKAEYKSILGVI